MNPLKARVRAKLIERTTRVGGNRVITIAPDTWTPIDAWIQAYEAHRDPDGRYGALGLKGNSMWKAAAS